MVEGVGSEAKPMIHWVFFWTAGISTLFVWNCFLSLSDYLGSRYRDDAISYYPFCFSLGGFLSFLILDKIKQYFTLSQLIITIPCLEVIISIAVFMAGEFEEEKNSEKFAVLLFLCFVCGFLNNIMQTGLIQYSFQFTYKEVSYFSAGTAVAGVLTSIIALINALALDNDAYYKKGLIYLIFQVISLSVIVYIFTQYFAWKTKQDSLAQKTIDTSSENVKPVSIAIAKEDEVELETPANDASPDLLSTFSYIHPCWTNMFLIYAISLSIHPVFNFAFGLQWDSPASVQVILLLFNIGDFVGKTVYGSYPMTNGFKAFFSSITRIVFSIITIVSFMPNGTTAFTNKAWLTTLFVLALSLSNGYLTSALFSISSERSPDKHKANSGFLMTMSLLLGLCYGSLCVLIGTKSVN